LPAHSPYTIKTAAQAGISRPRFTFTSWNTEPGGNGAAYLPGQIIVLTQSLTLYAQWTPQPSTSPPPEIDPVVAGSSTVSGTGEPGCAVTVILPGGGRIQATVSADGRWIISVPAGTALAAGQIVSAVQTCQGMEESPPATAIVQPRANRTVTGFVSPMPVNDLGFGSAFLRLFDIVVELRATFSTPAPPQLTTVAILVNSAGVGSFTIPNVPEGKYVLYIKRPGYLARPMNVTITSASPDTVLLAPPDPYENGVFHLWAGDVDGSLRVDNDDIALIIEAMEVGAHYPGPFYSANADLNADGLINDLDIMYVLENWNKTVRDYPGAADVDVFS